MKKYIKPILWCCLCALFLSALVSPLYAKEDSETKEFLNSLIPQEEYERLLDKTLYYGYLEEGFDLSDSIILKIREGSPFYRDMDNIMEKVEESFEKEDTRYFVIYSPTESFVVCNLHSALSSSVLLKMEDEVEPLPQFAADILTFLEDPQQSEGIKDFFCYYDSWGDLVFYVFEDKIHVKYYQILGKQEYRCWEFPLDEFCQHVSSFEQVRPLFTVNDEGVTLFGSPQFGDYCKDPQGFLARAEEIKERREKKAKIASIKKTVSYAIPIGVAILGGGVVTLLVVRSKKKKKTAPSQTTCD